MSNLLSLTDSHKHPTVVGLARVVTARVPQELSGSACGRAA